MRSGCEAVGLVLAAHSPFQLPEHCDLRHFHHNYQMFKLVHRYNRWATLLHFLPSLQSIDFGVLYFEDLCDSDYFLSI